jgi:hypothetical protein
MNSDRNINTIKDTRYIYHINKKIATDYLAR